MSKAFTLNSIIPRISSFTKTDALITHQGQPKRASTRTSVRATARNFSTGWVGIASIVGLIAAIAGLGFYIYTINASASKGYDFKKQQAVVDELTATNKRLTIQQAALGSIVKVNDVAATSGMVPVTGQEFLVAGQLSKR